MRLTIDLFIALCYVIRLVITMETYFYEKMNKYGLGNRIIPRPNEMNLRRFLPLNVKEHPEPLPTAKRSGIENLRSSYKSLYQGSRMINDTRVFRKRFEYTPQERGHQVLCEGMFDCVITHMAIESTEGIPIILRGGAGYRHFMVIVKAKPGFELKGTVRAYCKKKPVVPMPDGLVTPARRKFGVD